MKYMLLLNSANAAPQDLESPEAAAMYAEFSKVLDVMAQAGVLIDCAPLQPASLATTVRVRNGQTLLTDGPAAELREQVGGYTLLECANLDEALKWAEMIPTARWGSVEVRPLLAVRAPAAATAAS
jgi:hypothetical protein